MNCPICNREMQRIQSARPEDEEWSCPEGEKSVPTGNHVYLWLKHHFGITHTYIYKGFLVDTVEGHSLSGPRTLFVRLSKDEKGQLVDPSQEEMDRQVQAPSYETNNYMTFPQIQETIDILNANPLSALSNKGKA